MSLQQEINARGKYTISKDDVTYEFDFDKNEIYQIGTNKNFGMQVLVMLVVYAIFYMWFFADNKYEFDVLTRSKWFWIFGVFVIIVVWHRSKRYKLKKTKLGGMSDVPEDVRSDLKRQFNKQI